MGGDAPGTVFFGSSETIACAGGVGDQRILQNGASRGGDAIVGFRPVVGQVEPFGYSDAEARVAGAGSRIAARRNRAVPATGTTLSTRLSLVPAHEKGRLPRGSRPDHTRRQAPGSRA